MTAPSNLPTLYRNHQILVWVEDEVTRTYLREVWQDSNIGLLIAGGHENIHAVVKSARAQGFLHVFGFRDRDFGGTNRPKWQDDPEGVLTSEVFEVENLALDSQAMFACQLNSSKMTAEQISARLRELASKRCWWMSCRHAITDVRNAITDKFVEHPKLGKVTTQAEAEEVIFASKWWTATLPVIGASTTAACVRTNLAQHHARYSALLASGEWQAHFSGKELLQEVVTAVWTKGRPKGEHSDSVHLDFIRSIGEAQRLHNRIPGELQALRAVLRTRVRLPPQQPEVADLDELVTDPPTVPRSPAIPDQT